MTDKILAVFDKNKSFYDSITVYINESRSKNVLLNGTELESSEYSDSRSLIVRAIKEGRVLSSSFSGAGVEAVESFLSAGKDAVMALPDDEYRFAPAYTGQVASANSDPEYTQTTMQKLTAIAENVVKSAMSKDKRVKAVKQATASASIETKTIISTAGPMLKKEKTYFSAGAYLIADDGNDERDAYDQVSSTMLSELDFEKTGADAAVSACSLLGASQIKTRKYNILFSASVTADFIDLILELLDGENVYKGISMLKDSFGQKCASEKFTLIDDPAVKNGLGSTNFDDEGQPCEMLELISGGVLKNFLHNSYSAKALNMKNTNRAVVAGSGSMGIGCTNIFLKPTTEAQAEDVCKDFLKVTEVMGMHTADPISGDFSVGISGVVFKDGMAENPFKEAVLSGNLSDLLNGTLEVFSNVKNFGNIAAADTLFDKMTVSGV